MVYKVGSFSVALLVVAAFAFSACQEISTPPVAFNEELSQTTVASKDGATLSAADDTYIVVLKDNAVSESVLDAQPTYNGRGQAMRNEVAKIVGKHGVGNDALDKMYSKALKGFSARLNAKQVNDLKNDPAVAYVEKDQIITLGKPGGGGSTPPAQEIPWGITRVGGSVNYTGTAVAWIIDTGIDLDHPDLNVNAARGFNAFTSGRDAGAPDDGNGHGSHVAGTVAARNNSIGVVGVAAGATVIPIKVLDTRGSGSNSGVIAGVDFVAANGKAGDVANMSLGGGVSVALDNAVLNAASKGILFALAAGNESQNANNSSPGRINAPNVYTISAMNNTDSWASFSNFGNPPIDYCAPGVSIKSTWKDGGYNTISGTSMATPHVAGLLLVTGGNLRSGGTVKNDPDGNPDTIAIR
jgi:subtilisin family serine protease